MNQETKEQKLERLLKEMIRQRLLDMPQHHKLNLGLIAREPKIPDTLEYISDCIRRFTDHAVRDMFDNADTRMAVVERLMATGITLAHINTQEGMHREISDKLERTSFGTLLSAGVFGEANTPEMAERYLRGLVEMNYQDMMKEGAEKVDL